MCGIGGWIEFQGVPAARMRSAGELMADAMKHRGPNGYGLEVFGGDENAIAVLMHRRLSILGLGDDGKQPMQSADGRYWISFNGEIYNFLELASEFGLTTKTGTDTEVLLQLWCLKGVEAIALLDGFFAFAIWDTELKALTLARDKTGVKPLYYYLERDGDNDEHCVKSLSFGSEDFALKQVLHSQGIEVSLSETALKSHLEEGASDRNMLYNGMLELGMGCYLTYSCLSMDSKLNPISDWGRVIVKPWHGGEYLRLDDGAGWKKQLGLTEEPRNYFELLRSQLMAGMTKRLRSDVPIGFAVSGGIDSAALVGMAREIMGKEAHLHVFSVVAPGMDGDESDYQKSVVEHVGGIWHTVDVRKLDGQYLERYVKATHRIPVAWNNLAHFALCEAVKVAGVTVLFNGQGADELFGGYPHYYKAAFWNESNTLWPVRKKWPVGFAAAGKQWFKAVLGSLVGRKFETCVDVLMRTDYYGERLTQLLRFEDRNGMAAGIESRNPFADDYRMADAWLNAWGDDTWDLGGSLTAKLVDGYSKGYLRKAMDVGLVPAKVLWRIDKKGFTVPKCEMTLKGLKDWQGWVMSAKLDGLVSRGRRQKALDYGLANWGMDVLGEGSKPLVFNGGDVKLLDELFRWAAVGCFLEAFPCKIEGGRDGL
jgi:asparagine synthase (glutamine-hydrolysing)